MTLLLFFLLHPYFSYLFLSLSLFLNLSPVYFSLIIDSFYDFFYLPNVEKLIEISIWNFIPSSITLSVITAQCLLIFSGRLKSAISFFLSFDFCWKWSWQRLLINWFLTPLNDVFIAHHFLLRKSNQSNDLLLCSGCSTLVPISKEWALETQNSTKKWLTGWNGTGTRNRGQKSRTWWRRRTLMDWRLEWMADCSLEPQVIELFRLKFSATTIWR